MEACLRDASALANPSICHHDLQITYLAQRTFQILHSREVVGQGMPQRLRPRLGQTSHENFLGQPARVRSDGEVLPRRIPLRAVVAPRRGEFQPIIKLRRAKQFDETNRCPPKHALACRLGRRFVA